MITDFRYNFLCRNLNCNLNLFNKSQNLRCYLTTATLCGEVLKHKFLNRPTVTGYMLG